MSKKTKIWLIIAATLVLIGCVIFGGVMSMLNWDFAKLSTNKFETNTHKITDSFNNITVKTDTADIIFKLSQDNTCSIVCYEDTKQKHTISVQNDTLFVESSQTEKWYHNININFSTPKITVFLPETQYVALFIKESTGDIFIPESLTFESVDVSLSTGDVDISATSLGEMNIKATMGDVNIENTFAKSLDVSVSTGKVQVTNINVEDDVFVRVTTGESYLTSLNCKNLVSRGNTGDISLMNVVVSEKISIERTTGDVEFEKCDANEIFIRTDTGDVEGSLLTDKIFFAETGTGDVDVPKTSSGGKCEIKTSTGDIEVTVN